MSPFWFDIDMAVCSRTYTRQLMYSEIPENFQLLERVTQERKARTRKQAKVGASVLWAPWQSFKSPLRKISNDCSIPHTSHVYNLVLELKKLELSTVPLRHGC